METIRDWIEFFTDKRFSFRFKIANLIMGDDLRSAVAFSRFSAKTILDHAETYNQIPEVQAKLAVMNARKIYRWLGEAMGIEEETK